MNYHEYNFTVIGTEDFHKDLLIDSLSKIGFDTFEDTEKGFKAYTPESETITGQVKIIAEQFSSTFALSMEVSRLHRPCAAWKATCAIRTISLFL